jgi:predicted DNA-binding transcriptional regulator AlpA
LINAAPVARVEPVPRIALNAEESAATVGVSRRQFDKLVAKGVLPAPRHLSTQGSRWLPEELAEAVKLLPQKKVRVRRRA